MRSSWMVLGVAMKSFEDLKFGGLHQAVTEMAVRTKKLTLFP